MGDSSPKRKVNQARKRAARAYQAQHGCSYRQALQAVEGGLRRAKRIGDRLSAHVLRALFSTATTCANPECSEPTRVMTAEGEKYNADIAHISSLISSGPRYNPELPDAYLDTRGNMLLLCRNCHKIVDTNTKDFPAELLQRWKKLQDPEEEDGPDSTLRHSEGES